MTRVDVVGVVTVVDGLVFLARDPDGGAVLVGVDDLHGVTELLILRGVVEEDRRNGAVRQGEWLAYGAGEGGIGDITGDLRLGLGHIARRSSDCDNCSLGRGEKGDESDINFHSCASDLLARREWRVEWELTRCEKSETCVVKVGWVPIESLAGCLGEMHFAK